MNILARDARPDDIELGCGYAFQNRLPDPISAVEAFEVRKLCMIRNFELYKPLEAKMIQNVESPGMIEYSRNPSGHGQIIDRTFDDLIIEQSRIFVTKGE